MKTVKCFYCEEKFSKDQLMPKKFRYGKRKCCKSCHEENQKRSWRIYNDMVLTADDFYPNFPGDKVSVSVIRIVPMLRLPKKGEPFKFKIVISGADDDYLTKFFHYEGNDVYSDRVLDVVEYAKKIPVPITKLCLRQMGFYMD